MTDIIGELTLASVGTLAWRGDDRSGVMECGIVSPSGTYTRPLARRLNVDALADWARHYMPLSDHSVQRYPPVVLYRIQHGVVFDHGVVVTRDRHLIEETLSTLPADGPVADGLLRSADGDWSCDQPVNIRITHPTLLLKRAWWQNYAHWMIEHAAALALLVRSGMFDPTWRIAIGSYESAQLSRVVIDTIQAIVPNAAIMVLEDFNRIVFDELYLMTPIHDAKFQVPQSVEALRSFMPVGPAADLPRQIYIERIGATRRLENEAALRAICVDAGLTPIQPLNYSVMEQARLFANADLIVGVKGADFANAMFCRQGAALLLVAPGDYPEQLFWDLAALRGLNYFELFGRVLSTDRAVGRNPFEIDPDPFRTMLGEAMDLVAAGPVTTGMRYGMQWRMAWGYCPMFDIVIP